mmetsp:Transcript_60008/g.139790  ORF Transcript_60008/g.139790 Transcript_60008/m.139790 type:complete len:711 (-) Transcript_60008:109-2241(-)
MVAPSQAPAAPKMASTPPGVHPGGSCPMVRVVFQPLSDLCRGRAVAVERPQRVAVQLPSQTYSRTVTPSPASETRGLMSASSSAAKMPCLLAGGVRCYTKAARVPNTSPSRRVPAPVSKAARLFEDPGSPWVKPVQLGFSNVRSRCSFSSWPGRGAAKQREGEATFRGRPSAPVSLRPQSVVQQRQVRSLERPAAAKSWEPPRSSLGEEALSPLQPDCPGAGSSPAPACGSPTEEAAPALARRSEVPSGISSRAPSCSRGEEATQLLPWRQEVTPSVNSQVPPCSPEQRPEASAERVANLLAHREGLKAEVVRCFKRVAGNRKDIDLCGLRGFRALLSQSISVPLEALGNLQAEFIRFDFDGNGRIHFNEAYKLVKHHLWVHLKKHSAGSQVDVPHKSLDLAGYRVTKELGRGSQGVAMLATDSRGQEWCVKCYEKGKMTVGGLSELKDEFETMQRLSCDMIAHAVEIFQDSQFYYTIGEAYYGGDLGTLKKRANEEGVNMTEQWWRRLFRQCFQALAFMHEQAMMHCDIKEPNIMLKTTDFHSPEVVLIDFGVSKAMAAEDDGRVFGTPGYIPPETFEMKMWFPGGDVFSMGVCFLQVVGDQVPITSTSGAWNTRGIFIEGCTTLREVMQATLAREPPFHLIPKEMPGLTALVRLLLQKQMALRPRAPQVLQDPWFCSDTGALASEEFMPIPEHMLGTMGISEDLYQAM